MEIVRRDGLSRPVLNQPNYSLFDRWIETNSGNWNEKGGGVIDVCGDEGIGLIPFSPLAQGLLTDKYLDGIPSDSRAASESVFLKKDGVTEKKVAAAKKLQPIAKERNQTLAQLALAWVLRDDRVTSALIGASRPEQVIDCAKCLDAGPIDAETLKRIDDALADL